jgi:hypothetical protein
VRLHVQEIGTADEQSQRNDDQAVTGDFTIDAAIQRIRIAAWVIILALVAFQAYAQRYAVGPDGISYLDLSDAVVHGRLSELVNLYWSPLYPFVIGVARRVFGDSAGLEVPIAHAVNFVAMFGMFSAFEYLLFPILKLAIRTPRSVLRGPLGFASAYALFGFMALTMTTFELTTPDIFASTAAFLTLGGLLRLSDDANANARRDAIVVGVALGLGALAKSFMVPWAIVCFATLAVALRRQLSLVAIAVVAWGIFVIPWTATLSNKAGRLTFGDAGRLTYMWFVNEQSPPALGVVAPDALTPATQAILPGVGIVGDAPGTDPMWYDPARWNASLHPKINLKQQVATLKIFEGFYLQQFAPVVFLVFLIVVAPSVARRRIWSRGWVIYVPALAGMFAYAMVVVTSRYIMPFVLAIALLLLATVPIVRRLNPLLATVGLAIPALLESIDVKTGAALGVVVAVFGAIIVGALVPARNRVLWVLAILFAALASHVIFTPLGVEALPFVAIVLLVVIWIVARKAERGDGAESVAMRMQVAMTLILVAVFAIRFQNRMTDDVKAFARASSATWGNVPLRIAEDLQSHGVVAGARIAVIGPHAESYWARAGRLHIVASVPRPLVESFWGLPVARQDSLLALFAKAGAVYAVASMPPSVAAPPDGRWAAVRFSGWVRRIDGK